MSLLELVVSQYFAERMAERLSGIEDVEIEVSHTAKQHWSANHAKENRDIIFQEELRCKAKRSRSLW